MAGCSSAILTLTVLSTVLMECLADAPAVAFYKADFNLSNSIPTITRIIAHTNKPVFLLGITAIKSSAVFGVIIDKSLARLDDSNDNMTIRANFTTSQPDIKVDITVSVLIFEDFDLLEATTVNVTST